MKNEFFKLSIVTISYNQGCFLEETIKSIISQSYKNIEYIVIDGGSTDNTIDVLKKYSNYIHYWVSEKDNGPSDALSKGLRRCTGDILCYINSDDYFLPDAFDRVVDCFSNKSEIDVVYGHGYMCDKNSKIIKPIYSNKWNLNLYLNGYLTIVQQSTFFRKSAYDRISNGINVENKTCWDGELWVDLYESGAKFLRVPIFLSLFRVHDQSITGSQRSNNAYIEDQIRIRRRFGIERTNKFLKVLAYLSDPIIWAKRFILRINKFRIA